MSIHCVASVEDGLRRVRAEPARYAFVSIFKSASPDAIDGRIALMTSFGPVVREIEEQPAGQVRQMLTDMIAAGHPPAVLLHAESSELFRRVSDAAAVIADIDQSRAPQAYEAFMTSKAGIDGGKGGKVKWWSVAPVGAKAFDVGDEIAARVEADGERILVRYVRRDGQDAGIHAVFDGPLAARAEALVDAFSGQVDGVVYGVMPGAGGNEIVVQTLTFEIPTEMARALQDGKLPRHAGVPGAQG